MENKNVLTNSAILTAIWDETQKDNLELIKPFVEYLIGENYKIGDKIDNKKVIRQMDEKFSFSKFPETILIKVYVRLKNVVERKNGEYYLKKDISTNCQKFKERQIKLQEESSKVIDALKSYLMEINPKYKNIDSHETTILFTMFLEKMGFLTIDNIKELENKENYKKDQNNFYIAKFIINEFENETIISEYIEKIISGFMLANAIYMQVDSDTKESLKKVDIYLDAPLLLNVLNFKTSSQNESGDLLMQLLKDKKANIYCFRHNYDEVYSILDNYKNNLSCIREKTLEQLDLDRYTKSDVDRLMSGLEMMLNNHGIIVKETPEYVKNEYEGIIDEKRLTDFLLENYAENKDKIEGVVERDVKSIASIGRIRKDRIYKKIEDCKAIFVTTNYNLVEYSGKCLEQKKYEEIGFLITDVELITILWLKSFKANPDLPKLKLIENARTSLEVTSSMMKRVKDVLEKMEKEGTINQADVVSSNIQELNYYKREIMESIDGDEENINEKTILGLIDKENIRLRQELSMEREKLEQISKENEKEKAGKEEFKQYVRESCRKKASVIIKHLKRIYFIISILVFIAILIGSIYIVCKNNMSAQEITIVFVIGLTFDILGLIDNFVPKYSKFRKWVFKKLDNLEEVIYLFLLDKKKEEFKQFIKDK